MFLISWNVNGLRACIEKGFVNFFNICKENKLDFFCIQETKMQKEQATFSFKGYYEYWSSAIKKGYSGTLIYARLKPLNVFYGIDGKYSDEGRIITLEYEDFYLVNVYTPNSQDGLKRLDYRMTFEDDFREYLCKLKSKKRTIVCGDMNCAHKEIDIRNPKANFMNPGFTIEERNKMTELLNSGFTDSFRYLYPEKVMYSWWSYRFNARQNNAGWRIDYFLVSDDFKESIRDSYIFTNILGSDHCPVGLEIQR